MHGHWHAILNVRAKCALNDRYWYKPSWFPSEPTFIPSSEKGAAEDTGVLTFSALDGSTNVSHLILLDASSMVSDS
jgi:carotenoid cleavage dioxygenase-like enzyme